jgi:hypothetical protein
VDPGGWCLGLRATARFRVQAPAQQIRDPASTRTTKTGSVHEQRGNLRELATFLDLAFQMPLLVQQILQGQMGLVHLRTCVCGSLLMRARLGVCGAIVGLELAEKGHCARLDDLWVVARRRRRVRQPVQVLDDGVRVVTVAIQHGGGVL